MYLCLHVCMDLNAERLVIIVNKHIYIYIYIYIYISNFLKKSCHVGIKYGTKMSDNISVSNIVKNITTDELTINNSRVLLMCTEATVGGVYIVLIISFDCINTNLYRYKYNTLETFMYKAII